jgi:hypothetical protein
VVSAVASVALEGWQSGTIAAYAARRYYRPGQKAIGPSCSTGTCQLVLQYWLPNSPAGPSVWKTRPYEPIPSAHRRQPGGDHLQVPSSMDRWPSDLRQPSAAATATAAAAAIAPPLELASWGRAQAGRRLVCASLAALPLPHCRCRARQRAKSSSLPLPQRLPKVVEQTRGLALGQGDAHTHFGWAMDKRTDGRDGT